MTPGPLQILLVILLVVLIFGASRVPGIAENLAKGIKSFKKGLKDEDDTPAPKIEKKDE
ncbi:MAG: twin-arginine translocase TatA/TatE family subunit [Alphaproteobacteria bacterium]|nr:twin-arginine translocase TatA/TatE family subunit [Alphaproteobacteria bacterium]MCD8526271.1 twin-arginine translocase TatA/TatE family subunit [Alphaproteobacteria bacterium]MCD8571118.1 twin-arginine translocase TatA/TatE family subunit [Alphaproteobacteria bacterium]